MALSLYNTLTSKKEKLETMEPGHARVYVCGPTVYDYAHIGHARCYTVYDVLVRHLRATGTRVTYVRNLTDIDDKIINRAREAGEDPLALSERFTAAYAEDMARLGNLVPDIEPKVSTHLDEIRDLIQRLIDGGAAYQADGDVYFQVEAFPSYGKLSHRRLEDLVLGASGRVGDAEAKRKRHPADFALWKGASPGEPSWPSPWGDGRPGWHIECSAMSMRYLGEAFDLHGGGLDLVFPHHENEIAQSEAATGKPFVRMWMHNGFVEANKEKMSKSLGNFFTAREIFERVEPEALRYVMLTVHYRAPLSLDWNVDDDGNVTGFPQFEDAERRLEYIYGTKQRIGRIADSRIVDRNDPTTPAIAEFPARLRAALDDDLNMPVALAHMSELLAAANELCDRAQGKKGKVDRAAVSAVATAFDEIANVLGIGTDDASQILLRIRDRRAKRQGIAAADVETRIGARAAARANKDFQAADAIRDELVAMGVELLDGADGTNWRVA